jgi:hypothetical protein
LRSPSTALSWLVAKEWRELLASRAWWVMLVLIGPLVGVSFISAVRTYAELSGLNGTAAGVGEAFSPLVGIWAPTFSACELAAAFLLPFVAIRLVAGDRQSGALKLELQHPLPAAARIGAKALVLLGGWVVASLAPVIAIVLWRSYGGHLHGPELLSVGAGHVLNAGLTIALGAATAAIAEHPSTAAILTLSVTVGTWILNFVAAVHGGWWERAAAYTPTAMVAEFQHGLVRLDAVLVACVLIVAGLGTAAVWMRLGVPVRRRVLESTAVAAIAVAVIAACTLVRVSWDLAEDRANSFAEADEEALSQIRGRLRIEAHLAAEDPRRVDLEQRALSKLRRVLPNVRVDYISATSVGLFEQTSEHYGEIWYELDGRREMRRATTVESVLEAIYTVAGITPPAESGTSVYRGYPLAAPPRLAGATFYVVWPLVTLAAAVIRHRRSR